MFVCIHFYKKSTYQSWSLLSIRLVSFLSAYQLLFQSTVVILSQPRPLFLEKTGNHICLPVVISTGFESLQFYGVSWYLWFTGRYNVGIILGSIVVAFIITIIMAVLYVKGQATCT